MFSKDGICQSCFAVDVLFFWKLLGNFLCFSLIIWILSLADFFTEVAFDVIYIVMFSIGEHQMNYKNVLVRRQVSPGRKSAGVSASWGWKYLEKEPTGSRGTLLYKTKKFAKKYIYILIQNVSKISFLGLYKDQTASLYKFFPIPTTKVSA